MQASIGIATLQTATAILIPIAVLWLDKRVKLIRTISPVVVCYMLGMLLGNQKWVPFSPDLSLTTCAIVVALAIPLLLYSVDFIGWFRVAVPTVLGFIYAAFAVLVFATIAHFIFRGVLPESDKMAGMLVGVYTGGTPNMNAIGVSLGITSEGFIMLNTSDMIMSFLYLPFLMRFSHKLYAKILKPFPYSAPSNGGESAETMKPIEEADIPTIRNLTPAVLLTIVIVAIGVGLGKLIPQGMRDTVTILTITTLAILCSFIPKVRTIKGTQSSGQFLLLIFCVSIGATTDFSKLLDSSPYIFLFTTVTLAGSVALHLLLCWLSGIDRDTVLITSTAAVFSPPFVPPVAMALKNKEILISGIATGLVGYAVANYLGITLAWLLP